MLSDDELDSAFMSMSAAGFRVVRTWAFNDVTQVPSSGAYFQVRNLPCPFLSDFQRLPKKRSWLMDR
jgi:hypothetical protein